MAKLQRSTVLDPGSYKGHKIDRYSGKHSYVFGITGRFSKEPDAEPILTSVNKAKAWINEQIARHPT